jgi:hypothetical protein
MGVQLFDKFAEMVEKLPAKAVLRALQLQRQMLEDDLAQKRTLPMADARSIIAFSHFIENVSDPVEIPKVGVPIQHLGLYRNTVKRMIEDGELPLEAASRFDNAFGAMLKAA